jgi:hypothetical protein
MPVFKKDVYGWIKKNLMEILLILLFIFAAVKVLRVEWPF